MPNTFKYVREPFVEGKNILASEHFQFVEGGATFASVAAQTYPVGTAVARNKTTGKWVKFVDADETAGNYDDYGILNVEVEFNGTDDVIVGEVIVRGSVYAAKLDASATDAFKAKVADRIRFVSHV